MHVLKVQFSCIRQVQHPNIIQVMGSQEEQGQLMILMGLVDGPNLHDVIFSEKEQVVCVSMCVHVHVCFYL